MSVYESGLCFQLILVSLMKTFLDAFESALGLSGTELGQVEILRRHLEEPLRINLGHCADIVACCQHKLIVNDPVGFVIDNSRWVNHDHLIVLQRLIVS